MKKSNAIVLIMTILIGIALVFVLLLSKFTNQAAHNKGFSGNPPTVPTFQGNLQHTGLVETKAVQSFKKIKWKFKASGFVFSSPVEYDNIIYFGSDDDCLYAVNASTGKLVWKFVTEGDIRVAPYINNQHVIVASEDGSLYMLDKQTGKEKWRFFSKRKLIKNQISDFTLTSSPIVYENKIFYGSYDGHLYALDYTSGAPVWEYETDAAIKSTPSIYAENVYFASLNGKLYCLNSKNGALKWTHSSKPCFNNPAGQFISSPMIYDGTVYIGGLEFNIYAIDAFSGKEKWSVYLGDQPVFSTAAYHENAIYFGSLGWHNPRVYSFDLSGKQKWIFERTDKSIIDGSGNVTIGNWQFLDRVFTASPVIAENILYIGSWDGNLYALDTATGSLKWSFQTGGPIAGSALVKNGVVYVGSYDGYLYALE